MRVLLTLRSCPPATVREAFTAIVESVIGATDDLSDVFSAAEDASSEPAAGAFERAGGAVELPEFIELVASLGGARSSEELRIAFPDLDEDGSGALSAHEFTWWVKHDLSMDVLEDKAAADEALGLEAEQARS